MKKSLGRLVWSAVLSISLCLSLALPAESFAAPSFKDISGHWAEPYIESAVAKGIIKGYPDGRFLPDAKVTRAEFVSMLNRALGNTSVSSAGFKDVPGSAWYYNDVSKAVVAGYVSGFSDNTFRPNQNIARQEAAVMLARIVPTYGFSTDLKRFPDYRDVADWAYASLSKVSGKGYISGYTDGNVHPKDSLTRGQAAKIITDIVQHEKIVASDPMVRKDGTKLSGTIYSNNVTMHSDLDDGSATIDNSVVLGKLVVQGGGEGTITINNSRIVDSVINRTKKTVRVLAKGETVISNAVCSGDFSLQTSGLSGGSFGTGFEKVSFSASSKGSLQGTFPKVSIDGAAAKLELLSGSIGILDVKNAAKRSEITIGNKSTVGLANVYAESYFMGEGKISEMQVYAKGITYETKPGKWTINPGGDTPTQTEAKFSVTFNPEEGETNVFVDTKITLTFNSAVRKKDGKAIANADIPNIVTLREGSSTGSAVDFTATINSAKTIITLTPTSPLETKTKYYVSVKAGTIINSKDEKNASMTSYFTTGSKSEKLLVTYSPVNGDTNVPVDRKSFTVSFSESVTKYNGGKIAANDEYLKEKVILFQRAGTSVNAADYTVKINDKKNLITVTLKDGYSLTLNTKYTLGIRSSSLKTEDGDSVPSSSVGWTTAGTPVLSNISTVPDELYIDLKVTPNVAGTIYAVLLPENATAPSATQIKNGKDSTNADALVAANKSASTSGSTTIRLEKEPKISRDTSYKVFAVLYDGSGNPSAVVSSTAKTLPVRLKSLTVTPIDSAENVLTGFSSDKYIYSVSVPYGTSSVNIKATPTSSFDGAIKINGEVNNPIDINLGDDVTTVTITIQETGKSILTYTVNINHAGTAKLKSMTINGQGYVPDTDAKYEITEDPATLTLKIIPVEADAKIWIQGNQYNKDDNIVITLSHPSAELKFTIESSDGTTTREYKIAFRWNLPDSNPDAGSSD